MEKGKKSDEFLEEFRKSLPIYQFREELLNTVISNPFSIITGDTGSGKTTQIPQYIVESLKTSDLLKCKDKELKGKANIPKIVITQPRRVAAIQMAKRVAYEKKYSLGKDIGYSIRFEDYTSPDTFIKYVTDGILVRECLADPNLNKYNIIILDEAHERSLYTDILFALCKQAVLNRHGDLRLIITSATLDTKQFSSYFNNCPVFAVQGRCYPVDKIYQPSRMEKRVESTVKLAIRIHLHESPGHILAFLTGFEECEQACKLCYRKLEELASKGKNIPPMLIMPLYGAQNTDEQAQIFEKAPDNCRKMIFCTNIAETSLTVDGIGYVIDCGYVKQKIYNPKTSMDSLNVVPISKVQAIQRAGRAGRTGPGKCIRLYTEQFFESQMSNITVPEILRVNLATTILTLKSMNIDNVLDFDFMEKPGKEAILEALKQLYYLQAIDDEGRITRLGHEMAKFPLECSYTRALIASKFYGVLDEMAILVSLISTESIWYNVNKYDEERRALFDQKKLEFLDCFSDHISYLNIYKEWQFNGFSEDWCKANFLQYRALKQARNIRDQLDDYMNKVNYKDCERYFNMKNIDILSAEVEKDKNLDDYTRINKLMRMALCQGFFMNSARKIPNSNDYLRVSDGSVVSLDSHSGIVIKEMKPELVIFTELGGTNTKAVMKQVSIIEIKWINDLINLIRNVDIAKLRGKMKTPPRTLLASDGQIDLYALLEKKGSNKLEEDVEIEDTELLKKKADDAKERYLKRKTERNKY
jgi:ATP-dependent RNA helicase DHX8/PRP22